MSVHFCRASASVGHQHNVSAYRCFRNKRPSQRRGPRKEGPPLTPRVQCWQRPRRQPTTKVGVYFEIRNHCNEDGASANIGPWGCGGLSGYDARWAFISKTPDSSYAHTQGSKTQQGEQTVCHSRDRWFRGGCFMLARAPGRTSIRQRSVAPHFHHTFSGELPSESGPWPRTTIRWSSLPPRVNDALGPWLHGCWCARATYIPEYTSSCLHI